jgi:hypothetical protein
VRSDPTVRMNPAENNQIDKLNENAINPLLQQTGVPVQILVTFDEDGNIQIYRNGLPYGDAYTAEGVEKIKGQQTWPRSGH